MTAPAKAITDREDIAQRLLRSSAKASFDPLVEIDWDAPIDPDRYAIRPERVSLYGTELWEQLSEAQRKELSRHETASIASIGIWFETILMQMLVRHAYDRDPTSNHIQYAYTEIGDECRHSVMFAKMVGKLGARYYRVDGLTQFLGRVFKTISNTPLTFSAALYVEEISTSSSARPWWTKNSNRWSALSPGSTWWKKPGTCATRAKSSCAPGSTAAGCPRPTAAWSSAWWSTSPPRGSSTRTATQQ